MAVRVSRVTRVSSRRGALLIGTALGVSIAVLAAGAPNRALAADECGPAAAGATVTCATGAYATGVSYVGVEDLTLVMPTGTTVTGTVAVEGTGALVVNAQDGSSVTNSAGAGVRVVSTDGAASATVDDVSATGGLAVEVSGVGNATVVATSGVVQASGAGVVRAYSSTGTVSVTVAHADLLAGEGGEGADGVLARAAGGSVTVNAGVVTTVGDNFGGITAINDAGAPEDLVHVTSTGSVHTTGSYAEAITALAWGGDVEVDSVDIHTEGDGSVGIAAHGFSSTSGGVDVDSGTVVTDGDFADGVDASAYGGPVTVHSDSVTTNGLSARGIVVSSVDGDVNVTSGAVTTHGDAYSYSGEGEYGYASSGIVVDSNGGEVKVYSTTVEVSGKSAAGVQVTTNSGDVLIDSGSVVTHGGRLNYGPFGEGEYGPGGYGLYAGTTSGDIVIISDDVTTYGDFATGVRAQTYTGSVDVTTNGDTVTHGREADGVNVAQLYGEGDFGTVTVTNAGTIHTYGDYANGVEVSASDAPITVTNGGEILVDGYGSIGVRVSSGVADATVTNNGDIHSTGDYSQGITVFGGETGTLTINNNTTVTVDGAWSQGITTWATSAATVIDSHQVTTTGLHAVGIAAGSYDGAIQITSDAIVTSGACVAEGEGAVCAYEYGEGQTGASGIEAYSIKGDIVIDSGSITTAGMRAHGVDVQANVYGEGGGFGDVDVTSTTIVTTGDQAAGIQIVSGLGGGFGPPPPPPPIPPEGGLETAAFEDGTIYGDVIVDSGSITTSGQDSVGILVASQGVGDGIFGPGGPLGPGPLELGGSEGRAAALIGPGVFLSPHFGVTGDVDVYSDTILTHGDGAAGIAVSSGYTRGIYGEGEYSPVFLGGDVLIDSGSVHTEGHYAGGIMAQTLAGGVTVDSTSVVTEGDYSDGVTVNTGGMAFVPYGEYGGEYGEAVPTLIAGGPVSITSGEIHTSGYYSAGVTVAGVGSDVTLHSGSIETEGEDSNAVQIFALGGDVAIYSDEIITHGEGSMGMAVFAGDFGFPSYGEGEYSVFEGGEVFVDSGSVTTYGDDATAIRVLSTGYGAGEYSFGGGDVYVKSGTIATSGDYSDGIRIYAAGGYAYGEGEEVIRLGDVEVHSGSITTGGDYSSGIAIEANVGDVTVASTTVTTTGASSTGIRVGAEEGAVVVTSGTVTTSGGRASHENYYYDGEGVGHYETVYGEASHGVFVTTDDGDLTVNATTVTVSGDQAIGVLAESDYGDITLNVGSVKALGEAGDAVHAYSYGGDVDVTVTGQTQSLNGAGVHAYSYYGAVDVTLAAGSRVQGGTVGVYAYSATGTTITINGTVTSDSGFAIDVKGAAATIHNLSNTVIGGVSLTDNDDVFDNTGTFQATIDSQFGLGADVFDNTGLLQILPGSATPGTIAFTGLETFDNAGVVDLSNGHVGDVFDLSSTTWNGLAGSKLELDVSDTGSDTLHVGDATGTTEVALTNVGTGKIGENLQLIVSESDETGSEFVIDGDLGFVSYKLVFDPATDTWTAIGGASEELFEQAKFTAGAQNFWRETGDAWSARMTEIRDAGSARGEGVEAWGQAFGGEESENRGLQTFTVGGVEAQADVSYEQSYRGFQTGLDWAKPGLLFGFTAGYANADMDLASGNSAEFDGFNLGAYGGWTSGRFFVNGLAKADVFKAKLGLLTLEDRKELDGHTLGAKAEAGFRLGGEGWFAEPVARLSYVNVDMDGFTSNGTTVAFGDSTSLRGEVGARVGARWTTGVADLTPFLGVFAIDEFDGENETDFDISGDRFRLTDEATEAHGRVDFGVTAVTFHGLEGFVKGEALVGGDAEGYSARLGVRWRW